MSLFGNGDHELAWDEARHVLDSAVQARSVLLSLIDFGVGLLGGRRVVKRGGTVRLTNLALKSHSELAATRKALCHQVCGNCCFVLLLPKLEGTILFISMKILLRCNSYII